MNLPVSTDYRLQPEIPDELRTALFLKWYRHYSTYVALADRYFGSADNLDGGPGCTSAIINAMQDEDDWDPLYHVHGLYVTNRVGLLIPTIRLYLIAGEDWDEASDSDRFTAIRCGYLTYNLYRVALADQVHKLSHLTNRGHPFGTHNTH